MPLAPPVEVVIANHNNCAFVEKAMESVAHQTVRDLQVVVVDDASTDRSDEVIRRCLARLGDTRFRYVKLGDQPRPGRRAAPRHGRARHAVRLLPQFGRPLVRRLRRPAPRRAHERRLSRRADLLRFPHHRRRRPDPGGHRLVVRFRQAAGQGAEDDRAGADAGLRSGDRRTHLSAQRRRHLPSAVDAGGRHQHDGEHDVPARLRRSRARAAEPRTQALRRLLPVDLRLPDDRRDRHP